MKSELDFYQCHLDRVSRSFAFCIARLTRPFRDWVSMSYLLCRVLDTIEDAPWSSLSAQANCFNEFENFLTCMPSAHATRTWANSFPQDISAGEQNLIADFDQLVEFFLAFPLSVQKPLLSLLKSMRAGMEYFARTRAIQDKGNLHLKTLPELNRYCFFVAGIVGETVSVLFSAAHADHPIKPDEIRRAHHLGIFLQKVNILKDAKTDAAQGRLFYGSREEVKNSILYHADEAYAYTESLPPSAKDYRLFCLWSLFLGLQTLHVIEVGDGHQVAFEKLDRKQTEELVSISESMVDDPISLQLFYTSLRGQLIDRYGSKSLNQTNFALIPHWVLDSYQGYLKPLDLSALGLGG